MQFASLIAGDKMPYKWFRNLKSKDVDEERRRRIDRTMEAINNTYSNNVPVTKLLDDPGLLPSYVPNKFSKEKVRRSEKGLP